MMDLYKKTAIESARKMIESSGRRAIPIDVVGLIRDLGIEYKETNQLGQGLSGFIKRVGKKGKPVIVVNSEQGIERRRFTAAHELGHYMLHSMDDIFLDTTQERVLYRKDFDSAAIDLKEVQANNFAAELLMPRDLLLNDVGGQIPTSDRAMDTLIRRLAKKYQVSNQSMTIRLGGFLL